MVASQQQASWSAMTNTNGSQVAPTFPTLSLAGEAVSAKTPKFHLHSLPQMGLKEQPTQNFQEM